MTAENEAPARAFARVWAHRLHEVSFVPHRLSRTTIPLLEDLTLLLAGALTAERFDSVIGRQVGVAMVDAQLWSPAALRVSVELIHTRLRAGLDIGHPEASDRIGELLGTFTEAFIEAVRGVALTEVNLTADQSYRASKRHLLRAQVERQRELLHDPLSGLPNREALADHLRGILGSDHRPERIGLCLLNLAHFAELNDALGIEQGDALLREIGLRMRDLTIAHGVYAAHLGGDEFILMQQRTRSVDDAVKLFDLAREALAYPWGTQAHPIHLDAKAGLLERDTAGATAGELLRTVKMALTWAKSDPVGGYAIFEQHRHDADQRRHMLSRDLPRALQRGELRLAYQPIVCLDDQRLCAVEALARWDHPTLGPISPNEFIPLAERIRLLNPLIGRQLRQACEHTLSWQRPGRPVRLNINLSAAQLSEPALPAIIEAALDEAGFPAELLTFEVTEQAITDPQAGQASLAAIAALGARFAIDDFGIGHSNFARLREIGQLSVTTMKIDRSLLDGADTNHGAFMLRTLIDLAHGLQLRAVAEGVETEAQAAQLRALGCDDAQGHLFGKALQPGQITGLLD
jgi:diguanylate cyclase (GGDEF)-like protein